MSLRKYLPKPILYGEFCGFCITFVVYVYERRVGRVGFVTYLKCLVGDQQLVTRKSLSFFH